MQNSTLPMRRYLGLVFSARQHICLARYMLSPVRLSVRRVDHTKTVEVRVMKFSPYGSPIPPVLCGKFHPEILTGSPEREGQTREGGVKSAVFYL